MIREFVIVEIMLPGVSGEVGGVASIDDWTGALEHIDCRHYDFWCDQRDIPLVLDARRRRLSRDVVRRTLEADSELAVCSAPFRGSAAAIDVAAEAALPNSKKVLAESLQHVRESDDAKQADHRAQVRRSG